MSIVTIFRFGIVGSSLLLASICFGQVNGTFHGQYGLDTPVQTDYPAPVLDSVTVSGGDFTLNWSLTPGPNGAPAGGYDTVIDGVDQNDNLSNATFSKIVSGLSAGVQHSFQVEARYTQASPGVYPRSNVVYATIPEVGPGVFTLSSATYSVDEGDGSAQITIQRTGGSTGAVSVSWETTHGTATNADYGSFSATVLNFADGQTQRVESISITDDTALEGNETFNVILSAPTGGATLGSPSSAVVTILDNDADPPLPPSPTGWSIVGDPSFSSTNLPANVKTWYDRMWWTINNGAQVPNMDEKADSGDYREHGRHLNMYMTTLLHVFRLTGDYAILDEIDRLAQKMRATLVDNNSDGFLNWVWKDDPNNTKYYMKDTHVLDTIMGHSIVAAFCWAFEANKNVAGLSSERQTRYAERSAFWQDYLINHWEARWRDENNTPTEFPFINNGLTHPFLNMLRWHVYMYRITGNVGYYNEATRMAGLVNQIFYTTSTPTGQAWQWPHGSQSFGATSSYPLQSVEYGRYTAMAMVDLHAEAFDLFATTANMQRLANLLAHLVLDEQAPGGTAGDLDGSGSNTDDVYSISPWTQIGYWDQTSNDRIMTISEQIHNNVESNDSQPKSLYISAGMVVSLLAP